MIGADKAASAMSSTRNTKSKARDAASRALPDSGRPHESDPGWRRENVGRLLNDAIERFESGILRQMEDAGYRGFSLSHITVTRNLDLAGTRATELARRAGITKQSMSELIHQLEASGIVERRPDPADGRAKIVYFSKAGLAWLEAFGSALHNAEQDMCGELGPDSFAALKRALSTYAYGRRAAPVQAERPEAARKARP